MINLDIGRPKVRFYVEIKERYLYVRGNSMDKNNI
jgi:hypothetical protein